MCDNAVYKQTQVESFAARFVRNVNVTLSSMLRLDAAHVKQCACVYIVDVRVCSHAALAHAVNVLMCVMDEKVKQRNACD